MYITLSLTPDRNGFQGQVALNSNRINGFREVSYKDLAGNAEKDCSLSVVEPIRTILEKIREEKVRDDRNRS